MQTTPFVSEALQPLMQPYVRLAQGNMQLLTEFSASPEMLSLWMSNAQRFLAQASRSAATGPTDADTRQFVAQVQDSATKVAHSDAFAELIRGVMQNYTRFLFELAQAGMTVAGQQQADWMRQAQEASTRLAHVPLQQGPQRTKRARSAV